MNDFGRLLEKETPRLRRYAIALTRNMSRADDLVQDTLRPGNCEAMLLAVGYQPSRLAPLFSRRVPVWALIPVLARCRDICDPKPFVWTKSAEGGRSAAKRYGRRRRFSRMPTAPRVIDKHIRRRLRRVGGPDRCRSLSSWARTSSRSAVLGLFLP